MNTPAKGSMWRHKNGHVYTVILIANEHSEREDYPPTVVYEDEHGDVYAKPLATFFRSRVEYVLKDINSFVQYDNTEIRRKLGKELIDAERNVKGDYDDTRY